MDAEGCSGFLLRGRIIRMRDDTKGASPVLMRLDLIRGVLLDSTTRPMLIEKAIQYASSFLAWSVWCGWVQ